MFQVFRTGAAKGSGKVMCPTLRGELDKWPRTKDLYIRRTCPSCNGSGVSIESLVPIVRGRVEKSSRFPVKINIPKVLVMVTECVRGGETLLFARRQTGDHMLMLKQVSQNF